jgi:hypothetical protein
LTTEEIANGLGEGPTFVPFEKGDDSGEDGAARWRRDNPLVIDWSANSVELLRQRARQTASYRKPRLQNEPLWGQAGITWNSTARYLRLRLVPAGGIFGHKTPLIRSIVPWLPQEALLALLNAPTLDFLVRTFLGSLMQIEIGDIRRVPIPILRDEEGEQLGLLGSRAVSAKEAVDRGESSELLREVERELDLFVRDLYSLKPNADLWVVR